MIFSILWHKTWEHTWEQIEVPLPMSKMWLIILIKTTVANLSRTAFNDQCVFPAVQSTYFHIKIENGF